MRLLRSVLFALAFYPGTVLAVLTALAMPSGESSAIHEHARRWARFHRWCCERLLGIRTKVEGIIPEGPILFASKHQSMYETLELVLLIHEPATVLKRELADIPLWGRVVRKYGVIPITREGSAAALRSMLHAAKAAIAKGRPVLIFPEGTRVAPGERPPLKPGFAGLYRQLGLPVVPIALDSGRLSPRHRLVKRPGIVTFRFGEAIPPGLSRDEIEARVHAAINALETRPS